MSKKSHIDNDTEDELNQARFFAERGADASEIEEPGEEAPEFEEEDIADTKSEFRETPGKLHHESKTAEDSKFYGQGFQSGDDTGIRREPSRKGMEPDVEA
jgi:hypothetical protein